MHAATAAAQGWMPTEDRARPDTPALEACYRSEAFAEDLREWGQREWGQVSRPDPRLFAIAPSC
ncbi:MULTISPECIES: hypothetical protein [unclassified Rubrivivax]|uniref:hypothetical protein n=1 Tax=unclassified Rubrivivax TaxID=2649762 RepID=UPI0013E95DCD|nr:MULTISPECIES: hypothetical protein [unclassified Rubrivivax]MCC9598569.1 hypothetical protein [Rubrivivax sp. JA1055]MCC9648270.1 hypothetical protein [Rubrivivax sp. JA1029]